MVADPADFDRSGLVGEVHRVEEIAVLGIIDCKSPSEDVPGTHTVDRLDFDRIDFINLTFMQDHAAVGPQLDDDGTGPHLGYGLSRLDGLNPVGYLDSGNPFCLLLVGSDAIGLLEGLREETVGRCRVEDDVHALTPCPFSKRPWRTPCWSPTEEEARVPQSVPGFD